MASFVSGGGGGGSVQQHIFTGTCETTAAIPEKVVTLDDSSGFSLAAGVRVAVTFQYGNTATTPTLNVSSSGAKNIVFNSSATAYTSGLGTTNNTWGAYETVIFTYTGSYWTHAFSSWGAINTLMKKGIDYVTAGQKSGTTLGSSSTAEGLRTTASGNSAHAEGDTTVASSLASHAEGSGTTASGEYSHAEGYETTASGNYSHAEGRTTEARGYGSHAEGIGTYAGGQYAHAEGSGTRATGEESHAEGYNTTAQRKSQHVFGEYNVLDTGGTDTGTRGTYVEIVGNGTADDARSNVRTLDWSGNEVLAGKLTVGAAPTNNMDVATKQYVDNAIPTVPAQVSKLYTATCPTAAATAAKIATLDDSTGFSLTTGVRVAVTFTYGNTATTPTLNVSSSGAKTIAINSSATAFTTGNGTTYNTWGAYETVIFTYTGTYWVHEPSGYQTYLLAPKASPALTGTPTAPTASAGTNTTQIATTAFVQTALGNKLTYGDTDLTAGTSTLAEGVFYAYYE